MEASVAAVGNLDASLVAIALSIGIIRLLELGTSVILRFALYSNDDNGRSSSDGFVAHYGLGIMPDSLIEQSRNTNCIHVMVSHLLNFHLIKQKNKRALALCVPSLARDFF